jgi:putative ABC transport system substrate-binding protein
LVCCDPKPGPLDDQIRQNIAAVRAGLEDEGYVEGRHYRIDYHSPASGEADVAKLAQALVCDKVDVIHAIASVAIHAAQKATQTIPIVAHDYETDPVAAGFVSTLAKPGGNITGMFLDIPEIVGKLLDLLKTTLPELRAITVLWDPLTGKSQVFAAEQAARALGIEMQIREARAGTLEQTVRSVASRRARACPAGLPHDRCWLPEDCRRYHCRAVADHCPFSPVCSGGRPNGLFEVLWVPAR